MKIGITGPNGFVAGHLARRLALENEKYQVHPISREILYDKEALGKAVSDLEVVVHLAGLNRHNDPDEIYRVNIELAEKLIEACTSSVASPHIIFSSSTQEVRDNLYGNSKKIARQKLTDWATSSNGAFTGMIIPNVFGPFGDPYYNSVVATFSHQLCNGEEPKIEVDGTMNLIYVQDLVERMVEVINSDIKAGEAIAMEVESSFSMKVTKLLAMLNEFKSSYFENGEIPDINDKTRRDLFNTFRSYIDLNNFFPRDYTKHTDDRGSFIELIRLNTGGQVSFSTTVPGITRGNHYHTRKVERFSVIKGKATIEMRRVDQDEVHHFDLDGERPSYVDMPIWYTHNISNVGDEELVTVFWINEHFDPEDADTYFLTV